jgi:hypothetical protein
MLDHDYNNTKIVSMDHIRTKLIRRSRSSVTVFSFPTSEPTRFPPTPKSIPKFFQICKWCKGPNLDWIETTTSIQIQTQNQTESRRQ